MKNQSQILDELKKTRNLLQMAVASQQLIGEEGYRLLMSAVAEEIRIRGNRLMQFDCPHDETNQLRAEIRAYNFFSKWSVKAASKIDSLVKQLEGLQAQAQRLHDSGIELRSDEAEKFANEIKQLRTEVLSNG